MGFKCRQCARCCSDPSIYVMVNHRDILRFEFMLPDLDLFKILAFYQVQDKDSALEKKLMSPKILTNRGQTFLGLQKKDGKCIFLQGQSCQIYEFRPQICRSFPYTFQIRSGEIYWGYSVKAKEYCPGLEIESNVDKSYLEDLAKEILSDSREFEKLIEIWNYLAQNKLIEPTPQLLLQFITGKIKLSIESLENLQK